LTLQDRGRSVEDINEARGTGGGGDERHGEAGRWIVYSCGHRLTIDLNDFVNEKKIS